MLRPDRTSRFVALVGLLALLTTACSSPAPPAGTDTAQSDPVADRASVVKAHEAVLAAMESSDGAALEALLDDGPDLLVFHPAIETRFDGRTEISEGLSRMLGRGGSIDIVEVHLQVQVVGDVAWLTSHLLLELPGTDDAFTGRGTEVWRRRDDGWRLVHAHWSNHP